MEDVTSDVEPPMKREYALHFVPTLQKHSALLLEERHEQYSYTHRVVKFLSIINKQMFSMLHMALSILNIEITKVLTIIVHLCLLYLFFVW